LGLFSQNQVLTPFIKDLASPKKKVLHRLIHRLGMFGLICKEALSAPKPDFIIILPLEIVFNENSSLCTPSYLLPAGPFGPYLRSL
jgi:hypothetical protein